MLGKTAGGLFWMFRYLERSENTARLVDAGFRMALTRSDHAEDEWASIIDTASARQAFLDAGGKFDGPSVINFLLRDKSNPSSVISSTEAARNNARLVRTALTREVWEAVNETWIVLKDVLARPIRETELPEVLGIIRKQSSLVRGATVGTMLRNDIYNFARVGTFVERADNIARILDVKYYVLLPSVTLVGSALDNVQWETILRSASAERAFRWLYGGEARASTIADFLILDRRMPRSLLYCLRKISGNLGHLCADYNVRAPSLDIALSMRDDLEDGSIERIIDSGLHEFLTGYIQANNALAYQVEQDFRFYS
ncbi:alpha-E domain-containing protein [Hyphomonas sp. WL0036]|uniref:alpha-E domain-containing protein n=1 Tax=Hyphomonas sediminis TaxID=2866160 RepID=UPI001C7F2516|nr:alpha-E domain-containing protein [Hyphomonas sediminis]MBY9068518.1 alpha-E domain-containing protein [Hyphomonas sediminis]